MGRERNLIEIIRISEKQNDHLFVKSDSLFQTVSSKFGGDEDIDIKIEPRDLYEVSSNFFLELLVWIATGRSRHYIMVIDPKGKPIVEKAPEISGKVLKVARDWKGLGKAIKDSFGTGFEMPSFALVAGIGVGVLILVFLIWRGYIPLPRSWGL